MIKKIQKFLKENNLAGFILPKTDSFLGEYNTPSQERLEFISHFTGSQGTLLILQEKAYIFVDGRYTLQAKNQVLEDIEVLQIPQNSILNFIINNVTEQSKIAIDPFTLSTHFVLEMQQQLKKHNIEIFTLEKNPVDEIWGNSPNENFKSVYLYQEQFAGLDFKEKLNLITSKDSFKNPIFINDPHCVAWLLNIRGSDLDYTPLALSRALIVSASKVLWFIDPQRVDSILLKNFENSVDIIHPDQIFNTLKKYNTISLDPYTTPFSIYKHIKQPILENNPIIYLKAIKNSVEKFNIEQAHIKDGVALTKFLAWLEKEVSNTNYNLTEIDLSNKLNDFRKEQDFFVSESFPAISSFKEHGAIIHYRANEESNKNLDERGIYLIDSGAQYLEGTTDITRTLTIGEATPQEKEHFTRVLKGHIQIAKAKFPYGTTGHSLDILARLALWEVGLDYAHGTGHGVGCFLSVHEGPQNISRRESCALEPGMVISNEPGYYLEDAYGIRIESLVMVEETKINNTPMLQFKTLTLAPIDLKLIDRNLLSSDEIEWLNQYHKTVYDKISMYVDAQTKAWLFDNTQPI